MWRPTPLHLFSSPASHTSSHHTLTPLLSFSLPLFDTNKKDQPQIRSRCCHSTPLSFFFISLLSPHTPNCLHLHLSLAIRYKQEATSLGFLVLYLMQRNQMERGKDHSPFGYPTGVPGRRKDQTHLMYSFKNPTNLHKNPTPQESYRERKLVFFYSDRRQKRRCGIRL